MDQPSKAMPPGKALAKLFAVERSAQQMSLERKVLPDRSEARQDSLGTFPATKAAHPMLPFAGWLMAVIRAVVHASRCLDEDMPDVSQFGDVGLRRRIAA
ncbi:hypothetical protein AN416_34125 (plasmid) [Paraburkholderia caribensis]|nr:hypothetical protein AN416_34125 [Paraburkholderia caribensis]